MRSVVALATTAALFGCNGSEPATQEGKAEAVGVSQAALTTTLRLGITLPGSADFRTTAVGANEQLRLYDRSKIKTEAGGFAPVVNAGTVTTEYYVGAQSGNVTSAASINLHENSKVNGSATTAGVITKWAGASVTGTSTQGTPLPASTLTWSVPFETSSQIQTAYPGQTITLAPGAYSQIVVYNQAKVKLRTGTYYVDQLNLTQLSNVELDTSAGPIKLYVRTSVVFRAAITGGTPDRFLLGYFGNQPIVFDTTFRGTIIAPNAPVRFATPSAQHIGSIFAKAVDIDPDTQFVYKPFANWDDIQFDVTPRFECVQTAPSGKKIASFGYVNPNNHPVTVANGADNQFSPTPGDRRQPTTFLAGTRSSYFSIGYTGTAPSWQLNGATASVDPSKTCNNGYEVTAIKDATLSSASPNANFGAATTLEVSSQKSSVVKFDRKALLAARGAGRMIRSAKLEVSLSSGATDLAVYPMRQEWDEASATWTCAKDQDSAAATSRCFTNDAWTVPRRGHTYDNPFDPDAGSTGTASTGKVTFDVTESLQHLLASGASLSWMVQSPNGTSSILFSREGSKPAKLILDTVPIADTDLAGKAPFAFNVDTSLATTAALPSFADGQPRPLAVLRTSEGQDLQFVQNELLVMTDNATELSDIKARWGATEIASPSVTIPGVTKGHVLRIDTSRGNPTTLVPNLREIVNRPDGLQKVSSNAALGLLAAMAEEQTRGTLVGVNWLAPGAQVDVDGLTSSHFTDGAALDGAQGESSSNSFDWTNFQLHGVNDAWGLLFYTKKLKPTVDVAIIDQGFSLDFQDEDNYQMLGCASGECKNPFNCGGGNACPWHGVSTASAGFGTVNNKYGGAGPGAGVSDLTLLLGFGDMATTLLTVPGLVAGGERILNFSNAIPVPDWATLSTQPAEQVMWVARHIGGMLIFAAAGNSSTNVDARRCYDLWLTTVCPWEKETWFPCEGSGVDCVGATNQNNKGQASYSNYGDDVKFWATGTVLTGADPDNRANGTAYTSTQGTSFASPFMAGTAALTWAADLNQSAGDVEDCLDAAKIDGPNGRFVNSYYATACALGDPNNLAPIVDIINPGLEDNRYDSIGLVRLEAKAGDFEDGPITSVLFTSDKDGLIGTSMDGQPVLWTPPSAGLRTITAKVFDSAGLVGTDSVTLSFTPAEPNLKILSPQPAETVFLGLPVDLVGRMTNYSRIGSTPPYETSTWVGFHDNSIVFDHLTGSSVQATFNQVGAGHVTWSMTVDGVSGTATRAFNVVSDGKLHVTIVSPAKDGILFDDKPTFTLPIDVPATLNANSTSDLEGGVIYSWNVTRKDAKGVTISLASPQTQSATFTPTGTGCGNAPVTISVTAINKLGQMDQDSIDGTIYRQCKPE